MLKWIKALKSGKYEQTTFLLRNILYNKETGKYNKYYCCLGVLCDVKAKETKRAFSKVVRDDSGLLPYNVIKWSGMNNAEGRIKGKKYKLTELNDFKKWSFNKIAKYIKDNYKEL